MAHADIVMCINVCGKTKLGGYSFCTSNNTKYKFPNRKKKFSKKYTHTLTFWLPFIFHIKNHVQSNEGIWALKKHSVTHRKEKRKGSLHLKLPGEGKHLNVTALTIRKWCSSTLHEHTGNSGRKRRVSMGPWRNGSCGVCMDTGRKTVLSRIIFVSLQPSQSSSLS